MHFLSAGVINTASIVSLLFSTHWDQLTGAFVGILASVTPQHQSDMEGAPENELPSLDLINRENMRMTNPAAALRCNYVKELKMMIVPG